jgi:hypothetical protein
MLRNQ